MLSHEGERLRQVVVCTPRREYARASSLVHHNIGKLGDPETAIRQHDALKARLGAFGAEVIDIPELPGHPNSVFTRDTALFTPKGYIRLRLGLKTRQGEGQWMAEALETIGESCAGQIEAPGTVEGGDVLLAGRVAFVGRSIRTNEAGIRQLSGLLNKMGYEIRVITLPDTILHLDKVLMVLGPRQVLHCREFISSVHIEGFAGIGLSYGGDSTANVICLGHKELIVARSNSIVMDRLEAEGFVVHSLDLGEFAKGMGGPNCLIMPVERGT